MNIIESVKDDKLFRPFLADGEGSLRTWRNWLVALRVLYGMKTHRKYQSLIRDCTGRNKLPANGFDTALFLCGRNSGKSRMSGLVAAYEAALGGHETKLAPGDVGIVGVMAPSRRQAGIVRDHIRAVFDSTPITRGTIARETNEGFRLSNGIEIRVMTGDFRSVRGYTIVCAVVDELCFFGTEYSEVKKSEIELIRAVRPGLSRTSGKLICISSVYGKRGWAYDQWQKCWGDNESTTLVWKCPSRTMNLILTEEYVAKEIARDPAAMRAEYLSIWRDDVETFVSRDIVDKCVVKDRRELPPNRKHDYFAFADVSGGRGDDATLAIAFKDRDKIIVAKLCRWRPPFSPQECIRKMSRELQRYWLYRVTGDRYGAEFTASAFRNCGVSYVPSRKPKNELYAELLPRLNSQEIRLVDNPDLVEQLCNLERRTRVGGRDIIDHAPRAHDDLANAVAGVVDVVDRKRFLISAI